MIPVRLVTRTERQSANLSKPGRFAFFVFELNPDYDIGRYLSAVTWEDTGDTIIAAGTVDEWDSACYTFSNDNHPDDIVEVLNYIHTSISDAGFTLMGTKRPTHFGFYLR